MTVDLSVLIPARNEMFLNQTINSVLENRRGMTEIIVVLDGSWPVEPVPDHERVTLVYHPEPVGQRAATNDAARIARGQYVMKLDAHCAVGPGFDVIMLEDMQDDWTMVPMMYNLHAFDWVCQACGHRRYQGPTPEKCEKCGGGPLERDVLWQPKPSPCTTAMRFDRDLKFQYWSGYKKQQGGQDLRETMSLLGACWMLSRERYWELDICDEGHGGWGQQGTEVACKTWLSGGKLICTTKTWFSHMFRTQGGDFGFPYPISGGDTRRARDYSRNLWRADDPAQMPDWDKAIHPLSWLIEKFTPVPDWEGWETGRESTDIPNEEPEEAPSEGEVTIIEQRPEPERQQPAKGIVYYTDNRLDPLIMRACQNQLLKAGLPIVSVSLEPLDDFGQNIVLDAERGPLTMFRQILAGLEAIDADVVFFAEHDVIYHPGHFEFTPERRDLFYYNQNVWKIDAKTGKSLFHYSNHTSQLCAWRDLLLGHYRKRVAMVEEHGFSRRMGYEPGTHGRAERVDDYKCDTWMSERPNLDIRHDRNLTQTRWDKSQFRNQRYTKGWTVADEVPGWGRTAGRMEELFDGLSK